MMGVMRLCLCPSFWLVSKVEREREREVRCVRVGVGVGLVC
jgi:hypothetical protein